MRQVGTSRKTWGPVARPKKQKKRPAHINSLQRIKKNFRGSTFFYPVLGRYYGSSLFRSIWRYYWFTHVYAFCPFLPGMLILAFLLGDAAAAPTFFRLVKNQNRSICRIRVISPATGSDPQRLQKFSWFPPARHAYGSKVEAKKLDCQTPKNRKIPFCCNWLERNGKNNETEKHDLPLDFPPASSAIPSLDSNAGICCLFCILISVQVQQSLET